MKYAILALTLCASPLSAQTIRQQVRQIAVDVGVPPSIAESLVERESSFEPLAVNESENSEGLMQLQHRYLPWFADMFNGGSEVDPFDTDTAIRVGLRYLAWLHVRCGDWWDTVAAYNCGLSRVLNGRIPKSSIAYAWWITYRSRELDRTGGSR